LAISFLSIGLAYVSFSSDWRTVQAQDESVDASSGIIREILTWGFDNLNPDQITFSNTMQVMDGPTGHSLNFNGKNDYVKIASSKIGHVKNLAVSAWIKPDFSIPSNQFTILSKSQSFLLYLKPSGKSYHAEFSVYDGTAWHVVESKKQINSQWTKLLGVFDGRSIGIYINGTLDSSNLVQLPTLDDLFPISYDDISDADILIGSSTDGLDENNFFAGKISNVQITPSNGYLVDNIVDNQPLFSDGNNTYDIPQNGNITSSIHSNMINQTNITNLNPALSSSNSTILQIPSNVTTQTNTTQIPSNATIANSTIPQIPSNVTTQTNVTNLGPTFSNSNSTTMQFPTNMSGLVRYFDFSPDSIPPENMAKNATIVDGGILGTALQLASGGYVSESVPETDRLSNLSLSAWVNPDYGTGSNTFTILNKANSFLFQIGNIVSGQGTASFSIFDGITWHTVESKEKIPTGWTHLAATFNGSAINIYVNGILDSSQPVSEIGISQSGQIQSGLATLNSQSNVLIGSQLENTLTSNPFNGLIDEVSIYDTYLDDIQINNIYKSTVDSTEFTPSVVVPPVVIPQNIGIIPVPTPTAELNFSSTLQNSSNTFGDASISSSGVNGTALELSGHGYMSQNMTSTDQISHFTISAWVKPDYQKGSSEYAVLSKDRSFLLAINNYIPPKKVAVFSIYDGIQWHTVESTSQIPQDWTHLAATFNGTTIAIYVNGNQEASVPVSTIGISLSGHLETTTIADLKSQADVIIGAQESVRAPQTTVQNLFGGQIDEVNVYDSLLDSSQIQKLYDQGVLSLQKQTQSNATTVLNGTAPGNGTIVNETTTTGANSTNQTTLLNGTVNGTVNGTNVIGTIINGTIPTNETLITNGTKTINGTIPVNGIINATSLVNGTSLVNATDVINGTAIPITPSVTPIKSDYLITEKPGVDFEFLSDKNLKKAGKVTKENLGQRQNNRWVGNNSTISVTVFDPSGTKIPINTVFTKLREGKFHISLASERSIRAGQYVVKVTLTQNGKSFVTQTDYSWGLVSLNTDKSIFQPSDVANFVIAVLDNQGHSVCNANVLMTVTDPVGLATILSSGNGVTPSTECGLYNAQYVTGQEGNYTVYVAAKNPSGVTTFNTSFLVQKSFPFDIIRTTPSKIDPVNNPNSFNVRLDVSSYVNTTSVNIQETVPSVFHVTTDGIVQTVGNTTTISWNKNLIGNATSVQYSYSVPLEFPRLYALGPATISYGTNSSFTEARPWFVANDPSVAKLYLHATTSSDAPTNGEKSAALPVGTFKGNSGTGFEDLSMSSLIGTSQTTKSITGLAQTGAQDNYIARFTSPPLTAQTIAAGTWTFAVQTLESNAGANSMLDGSLYVWRPSTDSVVGYVYDSTTALGTEWGTTTKGVLVTVSGNSVTVKDGDVLVFEVWRYAASQTAATAWTQELLFDGTTDVTSGGTGSSAASYIQAPTNLVFKFTKLYLHATTSPDAPTNGEKSTALPVGTFKGNSGTGFEDLSMSSLIGTSQTTKSITSLGQTAAQDNYIARFTSPPLADQTIPAGTWTLGLQSLESNANANSFFQASLYVWRPATSSVVGYVYDNNAALGTEWVATTQGRVVTVSGNSVAVQSGDVLVLEVWRTATQGSATAWAQELLFDGTTDVTNAGTGSSAASFIQFNTPLEFGNNLAEQVEASDLVIHSADLKKVLTETVTSADQSLASEGKGKTLSESVITSSASLSSTLRKANPTESVVEHDLVSAAVMKKVTLAESVVISDDLSTASARKASLSETVTSINSLSTSVAKKVSLTESVIASDTSSTTALRKITLTESVIGNDLTSTSVSRKATLSETMMSSDASSTSTSRKTFLTETVTVHDSLTTATSRKIGLSETSIASDGLTTFASRKVTLSETITASDGISTAASRKTTLAESVHTFDVSSTAMSKKITLSETVTVHDFLTTSASRKTSLSEILTVRDFLTTSTSRKTTLTESVTTLDTSSTAVAKSITLTDTVNTHNLATTAATRNADLAGTVTTSDVMTTAAARKSTFTETVQSSDSLTTAASRKITLAENVIASGMSSTSSTKSLTLSEKVTDYDIVTTAALHQATLSENVVMSDLESNAMTKSVTLNEPIIVLDISSTATLQNTTPSETVTTNDLLITAASKNMTLQETVMALTGVTTAASQNTTMSGTTSISDGITTAASRAVTLSETVTAFDTPHTATSFNTVLGDTVTTSDASSSAEARLVILPESVTVSDGITTAAAQNTVLSESVVTADTSSTSSAINITLPESVTVSGLSSNAGSKNTTLTESLSISDGLSPSASSQTYGSDTLTLKDTASLLKISPDQHLVSNNQTAIIVTQDKPNLVVTSNNTALSSIMIPTTVTSPTINYAQIVSSGTVHVTHALNITKDTTGDNKIDVAVTIPAATDISNPAWNGILQLPTSQSSSSLVLPAPQGQVATAKTVIQMGSSIPLTFNNAVRILFVGQAGAHVGYFYSPTSVTETTPTCASDDQSIANGLAAGASCKIDVGGDLVVWTKHFTSFVTWTLKTSSIAPSAPQIPTASGGGGGYGTGVQPPAPTSTETAASMLSTGVTLYDVTYDVCDQQQVQFTVGSPDLTVPVVEFATSSGVVQAQVSSHQPYSGLYDLTKQNVLSYDAKIKPDTKSLDMLITSGNGTGYVTAKVDVTKCKQTVSFAPIPILGTNSPDAPKVFDEKLQIGNDTISAASSNDKYITNQNVTISGLVYSSAPLDHAEIRAVKIGSNVTLGYNKVDANITSTTVSHVYLVNATLPQDYLVSPAITYWMYANNTGGFESESDQYSIGVSPTYPVNGTIGFVIPQNVPADLIQSLQVYFTNNSTGILYGSVSLVVDGKQVSQFVDHVFDRGTSVMDLDWNVTKTNDTTTHSVQAIAEFYGNTISSDNATVNAYVTKKIVPLENMGPLKPLVDKQGNVVATPGSLYSSSSSVVKFHIVSPDGTCVIGEASTCLVHKSTVSPSGRYSSISLDGENYLVYYPGGNSTLERFLITSLQPITGDWKISLEKNGVEQKDLEANEQLNIRYVPVNKQLLVSLP